MLIFERTSGSFKRVFPITSLRSDEKQDSQPIYFIRTTLNNLGRSRSGEPDIP
jgi:hypothetical protein